MRTGHRNHALLFPFRVREEAIFARKASPNWAKICIHWIGTKWLLSLLNHLIAKYRYTSQFSEFSSQVNSMRYVMLSLVPANLYIMESICKLIFINSRVTLLFSYFCAMDFWGVLTSELTKMWKAVCCLPPAMYTERSHLQESARGLCFCWSFAFCMDEVFCRGSPICLQAGVCNESLGARILYILFCL